MESQLPKLDVNDYLIIMLPITIRTRLPINLSINTLPSDLYENYGIIDYFVGTNSYDQKIILEYWDTTYNLHYFKYHLETQEMINASVSAQKNFYEIVESLIKITPCKNFVMTWDVIPNKSDLFFDKEMLTNEIGYWETLGSVYENTNGENGVQGDIHWSIKMNNAFFDFLITYFGLKKIF